MANIKSQIKRNRQNETRRVRNQARRSELKTRIQRVEEAVEAGNLAEAEELYKSAQKRIDMAARDGLLHPKTAGHRKARLAKLIDSIR